MSLKIDRMRFQPNKTSYYLGLLGFVAYIIYLAATLDYIPKNIFLGLEIMIDLVFLMTLFYGMEKVKNYNLRWSFYMIILGIINILRALWHPIVLGTIDELMDKAVISGISIIIAGVLIIISGIIGMRKSRLLSNYLKKTGLN